MKPLLLLLCLGLLSYSHATADVSLTQLTIFRTHEPDIFFFRDSPEVYLECEGYPRIELDRVDDTDVLYKFPPGEVVAAFLEESSPCVECRLGEEDPIIRGGDDTFGTFDLCFSSFKEDGKRTVYRPGEFTALFECEDCRESEPETTTPTPVSPAPQKRPVVSEPVTTPPPVVTPAPKNQTSPVPTVPEVKSAAESPLPAKPGYESTTQGQGPPPLESNSEAPDKTSESQLEKDAIEIGWIKLHRQQGIAAEQKYDFGTVGKFGRIDKIKGTVNGGTFTYFKKTDDTRDAKFGDGFRGTRGRKTFISR